MVYGDHAQTDPADTQHEPLFVCQADTTIALLRYYAATIGCTSSSGSILLSCNVRGSFLPSIRTRNDAPFGLIPTITPVRTLSFEQRSIPRADNRIREPMASFGLC